MGLVRVVLGLSGSQGCTATPGNIPHGQHRTKQARTPRVGLGAMGSMCATVCVCVHTRVQLNCYVRVWMNACLCAHRVRAVGVQLLPMAVRPPEAQPQRNRQRQGQDPPATRVPPRADGRIVLGCACPPVPVASGGVVWARLRALAPAPARWELVCLRGRACVMV